MTISGHFLANYIDIFHKKRGLDGYFEMPNKSEKSQFVLKTVFFNFGRKKTENLSFKNGHFLTTYGDFFGNNIDVFHKTEIKTVLLRCLVCQNLN